MEEYTIGEWVKFGYEIDDRWYDNLNRPHVYWVWDGVKGDDYYIGYALCPYSRWFTDSWRHLILSNNKTKWNGYNSPIGTLICECLPVSFFWKIKFLFHDDLVEMFPDKVPPHIHERPVELWFANQCEGMLIRQHRPKVNSRMW